MRRTKEEAQETRNLILQTALDCFSTHGYALTTFSGIASRIKMTKGAIFWHFDSKEHLLAEVIAWMHTQYEPLSEIKAATSLDDVKVCFMDWAQAVEMNENHRRFLHFIMSRVEWSKALTESLGSRLEGMMIQDPFVALEACIDRLKASGEVVSDLSSKSIAVLFCTTFFGVHREALLRSRDIDVRETLSRGLDFVIQGIRSK
jgi:TetR/AcrR family acrAB operon transcriptional repressor